ncbi:thioredoxin family protein [Thermodesulfobacteriota bacterium]
MKKIRILGPGCPRCKKLAENTIKAAEELAIECDIEKVTDINEIIKAGVMVAPALVVDGAVKISGGIPSVDEIKKLIS